jgi:hypothetical protein
MVPPKRFSERKIHAGIPEEIIPMRAIDPARDIAADTDPIVTSVWASTGNTLKRFFVGKARSDRCSDSFTSREIPSRGEREIFDPGEESLTKYFVAETDVLINLLGVLLEVARLLEQSAVDIRPVDSLTSFPLLKLDPAMSQSFSSFFCFFDGILLRALRASCPALSAVRFASEDSLFDLSTSVFNFSTSS